MLKLFSPPRLTGKYLKKVLRSGWYTTGPVCARLETAIAEHYIVHPECVVLGSSATACFAAIIDHLRATLPSFLVHIADATWPGMHMVLKRAGQAFDSTFHDGSVCVVTDIGGRQFGEEDEEYIQDLAHKPKVVIHDASHSWEFVAGANRPDYWLASFYPTKLVPGVEGGVVICRSPQAAAALRTWLYCGLTPGAAGKGSKPVVPGAKANMTDVAAALNLEAFEKSPAYIQKIQKLWERQDKIFRENGMFAVAQPIRTYLFQIRSRSYLIPRVMKHLSANGISSAWNFSPNDLITLPMPERLEDVKLLAGVVRESL